MPDLNYIITVFIGVDIPKVLEVAAQNTRNKQIIQKIIETMIGLSYLAKYRIKI